jgi:hypothetical protein
LKSVGFGRCKAADFDDRGSLPRWNGDRTFANEVMRSEDQPRLLAALLKSLRLAKVAFADLHIGRASCKT